MLSDKSKNSPTIGLLNYVVSEWAKCKWFAEWRQSIARLFSTTHTQLLHCVRGFDLPPELSRLFFVGNSGDDDGLSIYLLLHE